MYIGGCENSLLSTMNSVKGPPLTKQEVSLLVDLIQQNNVIMSKQTDAGSNRRKEKAWQMVTEQFNAKISSCPRRPYQLRLKWDNLKKSARRRATNKKYNIDGFYLPPDDILDTVLMLLENASDSGDSGSNSESAPLRRDESDMEVELNRALPPKDLYEPAKTSSGTHSTVDSESDNDVEVETPILTDVLKSPKSRCRVIQRRRSDIVRKNIAIAEYYEAKKKKIDLEIKKLQIEIDMRLNNHESSTHSSITSDMHNERSNIKTEKL